MEGISRQTVRDYIANGISTIKGMSSTISAQVVALLIEAQTESGINGPVMEIGVFEGRMFVLMALASEPGEKLFALDTFRHPDDHQIDRFRANLDRFGIDKSRVIEKKGSSIDHGPWKLRQEMGVPARFIHIDGDHSYNGVMHDLMISHKCMSDSAIICMDDVMHPYYPGLTLAVHDYLRANPSLAVFAVVDRASIVAASKYMICHRSKLEFYQAIIQDRIGNHIRHTQGDFMTNRALIVMPDAQKR